jgi:hypothetical protein
VGNLPADRQGKGKGTKDFQMAKNVFDTFSDQLVFPFWQNLFCSLTVSLTNENK